MGQQVEFGLEAAELSFLDYVDADSELGGEVVLLESEALEFSGSDHIEVDNDGSNTRKGLLEFPDILSLQLVHDQQQHFPWQVIESLLRTVRHASWLLA